MGREIAGGTNRRRCASSRKAAKRPGSTWVRLCFDAPLEELVEDRAPAARPRRHEPRHTRRAPRARNRAGLRRRTLGGRVLRAGGRTRDVDSRRRSRSSGSVDWPRPRPPARTPGSMAAILGLEDEVVEELCRRIGRGLAGELQLPGSARRLRGDPAVDECRWKAEDRGCAAGRSSSRVTGAFHSPLVAKAAERLRPAIEQGGVRRARRALHVHRQARSSSLRSGWGTCSSTS